MHDDLTVILRQPSDEGVLRGQAERLIAADDPQRLAILRPLSRMEPEAMQQAAGDLGAVLRAATREILQQPLQGVSPEEWADGLASVYWATPANSSPRYWLLLLLNRENTSAELTVLAELLADDPPDDPNASAAVVARLLQDPPDEPQSLFPRLLDGIAHRSVAAPILDLTNYFYRTAVVDEHPAAERHEQLAGLLGALVAELHAIESQSGQPATQPTAKTIDDSVALAIALCDALGQIGRTDHLGRLREAMDLKHRRIRVAAASALAALGEDEGRVVLLEMAEHPVVRLLAVQHAESLGVAEQIAAEHRSPEALAESRLALWLAQPAQFGIPPTQLELLAHRQLYWPGFDEAEDFYLFRFVYQVGQRQFVNVALSGARVNACGADLTELSDDDCFAIFAGADIDHEEVFQTPRLEWSEGMQREAARFEAHLKTSGFDDVQPQLLQSFFGQLSLVAEARRMGSPVVVSTDGRDVLERPAGDPERPLKTADLAALDRGARALQTFNPDE